MKFRHGQRDEITGDFEGSLVVFHKLLIHWDSHKSTSQRMVAKGDPVSSTTAEAKVSLMAGVRGQCSDLG